MSDLQSPNIPQVGSSTDPNVRRGLDAIRDFFNKLFQQEGGLATVKDLQTAGILGNNGNPIIDLGAIPPKITSFGAVGAFRTIILSWDDMGFAKLSHYEIFRSESADIGGATKVGTTSARVFSDLPPTASISKEYWYWVRIISTTARVGPYSESASATTANDPAYLLQLLSNNPEAAQFAVPGEEPFYVLTSPTTINGQLVPAGMYVNTANIVDLTSANIRAESIAADRLYSPYATLAEALIGTADITNAMIGNYIASNNFNGSTTSPYSSAGTAGWCIAKNGDAAFSNVKVRGDVEATSIKANTANIIDTLMLQGETVVIPRHAYSSYMQVGSSWADLGTSITITQEAGKTFPVILIFATSGYIPNAGYPIGNEYYGWAAIARNGNIISPGARCAYFGSQYVYNGFTWMSLDMTASYAWRDDPGAGTHTYTVYGRSDGVNCQFSSTSLVLMGVKR